MKTSGPAPKGFDTSKYQELIDGLDATMPELEFERACDVIVHDILSNYEGFERIEKGPDFRGTPFDFLGLKNGIPYIIEFKGSLNNFNSPGETQKRRLKEILTMIDGLEVALLQVKLRRGEYRIFYNDDMEVLFQGQKAAIEPIIDWIRERIR